MRFRSATPLFLAAAMGATSAGASAESSDAELIERYCPAERVDDALTRLESKINMATWDALPSNTVTPQTFNATNSRAISLAYEGGYEATGVEWASLEDSFNRTRAYVRYRLQRHSEVFTDLPDEGEELLEAIDAQLAQARLLKAREWVEEELGNHRNPNAKAGWDIARAKAFQVYINRCGDVGLGARVVAPRQSAIDSAPIFLTCPGLLVGMHDVLGEEGRPLIADAFAFGYGIQLGSLISEALQAYWKDRPSADKDAHLHRHRSTYLFGYWSAMALAERMEGRDLEDRRRLALLAVDAHCRERSSGGEPAEQNERFLLDVLAMPELADPLGH